MLSRNAAVRVRFDNVAELPADRLRDNCALKPADQPRRQYPLHQPAEHAADADIHFEDTEHVVAVFAPDLEGHICDADHLAALCVDNLLVEKIPRHAQHVLVVVVGSELFVLKINPVKADRPDLIVPHREPGPVAADEVAVDAYRVDKRDQGGVLDAANGVTLKVVDLKAEQLGEEEEALRHCILRMTHSRRRPQGKS